MSFSEGSGKSVGTILVKEEKRGRCRQPNCVCVEYKKPKDGSNKCSSCGHFPTAHRLLSDNANINPKRPAYKLNSPSSSTQSINNFRQNYSERLLPQVPPSQRHEYPTYIQKMRKLKSFFTEHFDFEKKGFGLSLEKRKYFDGEQIFGHVYCERSVLKSCSSRKFDPSRNSVLVQLQARLLVEEGYKYRLHSVSDVYVYNCGETNLLWDKTITLYVNSEYLGGKEPAKDHVIKPLFELATKVVLEQVHPSQYRKKKVPKEILEHLEWETFPFSFGIPFGFPASLNRNEVSFDYRISIMAVEEYEGSAEHQNKALGWFTSTASQSEFDTDLITRNIFLGSASLKVKRFIPPPTKLRSFQFTSTSIIQQVSGQSGDHVSVSYTSPEQKEWDSPKPSQSGTSISQNLQQIANGMDEMSLDDDNSNDSFQSGGSEDYFFPISINNKVQLKQQPYHPNSPVYCGESTVLFELHLFVNPSKKKLTGIEMTLFEEILLSRQFDVPQDYALLKMLHSTKHAPKDLFPISCETKTPIQRVISIAFPLKLSEDEITSNYYRIGGNIKIQHYFEIRVNVKGGPDLVLKLPTVISAKPAPDQFRMSEEESSNDISQFQVMPVANYYSKEIAMRFQNM